MAFRERSLRSARHVILIFVHGGLILRASYGSVSPVSRPSATPAKFDGFPVEMALRSSQIRAGAAESALMVPGAFAARGQYARLKMPVSIIAGEEDRSGCMPISPKAHSTVYPTWGTWGRCIG